MLVLRCFDPTLSLHRGRRWWLLLPPPPPCHACLQLTRILSQLCAANRGSGGGVVVVLTQEVRACC